MSVLRGIDGVLKACSTVDGTYTEVAYADSFEVSVDIDINEITKLNQQSKEKVSGLRGGSASIAGALIWDDTMQQAMLNQFFAIDNKGTPSPISNANLFFRGYVKQGDSGGSGDELTSVYLECELVPAGLSVSLQSTSHTTFTYSSETTGDVTLVIEDETT